MARKSQSGFTIIEVLIVLAIAVLIILIVFFAVPALKRTQRNFQRKSDAGFVLSQRQQYNIDYVTSHSGGTFNCGPPWAGPTAPAFCAYIDNSLSYYRLDQVNFRNSGLSPPDPIPTNDDPEVLWTISFLRCNDTGTGAVAAPGPNYQVVLFAIEGPHGSYPKCIESGLSPHS